MIRPTTKYLISLTLTICMLPFSEALPADEASTELVQMIVALMGNQDQDFRAAGLEHVRSGAKGTTATKLFTDQLAKLPAASQVSLLSALADRGDTSAKPVILQLQKTSQDDSVKGASIAALGRLGNAADIPLLIDSLTSKSDVEQAAARKSLSQLNGNDVTKQLSTRLNEAAPALKASLIEVLATRRAKDAVPAIIAAAVDETSNVRGAAMNALGQMGSPDQIAAILPGVLKAVKGGERDAAEKNVALVCARIEKENLRAEALIKAMETIPMSDRDQLLSLVGRVGGKKLIEYVGDIAQGTDASRRKLAIDALSKWPDASVADMLREITEKASDSGERNAAFQAYVKVCAARDRRKDEERLESLKKAFKIAKNADEQSLVINRCRTAYHVDTLRFVLPHLDDAQFAQIACETIVELAHHREVRDPNKAEFDKALDKVIETSKNATMVERAKAYKKGETWSRS
jgi:HEAT repeat protein